MDGMARAATNDADKLIDAARRLKPAIDSVRDGFDHHRRLPPAVIEAMRDTGLFGLWLPRRYGGAEVDIAGFVGVIEELARLDGSLGWCAAIAGSYGRLAGYLAPDVVTDIFRGGRSVIAGQLNPAGKAVAVANGYRVTGRWAYGSGIEHSAWSIGICVVHDGETPRLQADGSPTEHLVFMPTREVEIIDTWRVGGLRATGSHDYRVADVFVAEDHAIAAIAPAPTTAGTLYALPFRALFGVAIAATTLGIARAAIDAFEELALSKASPRTAGRLRDLALSQSDLGRAEARLRAARAFLVDAGEEVWRAVERGDPLSTRHSAVLRLANTETAVTAARVVDLMYNAGGGSSVYETSRLERCHRDIHAATQHRAVSTANYELAGRIFLGLDPGMRHF
jgi:indole-3-acetate monooxygenase